MRAGRDSEGKRTILVGQANQHKVNREATILLPQSQMATAAFKHFCELAEDTFLEDFEPGFSAARTKVDVHAGVNHCPSGEHPLGSSGWTP